MAYGGRPRSRLAAAGAVAILVTYAALLAWLLAARRLSGSQTLQFAIGLGLLLRLGLRGWADLLPPKRAGAGVWLRRLGDWCGGAAWALLLAFGAWHLFR